MFLKYGVEYSRSIHDIILWPPNIHAYTFPFPYIHMSWTHAPFPSLPPPPSLYFLKKENSSFAKEKTKNRLSSQRAVGAR